MSRSAVWAGLLLGIGIWGRAVEIPIRRQGGGPSTAVGFVDMERIYREYPETQKARAAYREEAARHKTDLDARQRAVDELQTEIEALNRKAALPGPVAEAAVSLSTAGAVVSQEAAALPEGSTSPKTPAMFALPAGAALPVAPGVSTGTVSAADLLTQKQALLEKRREELTAARNDSAKVLRDFEAERSQIILGRLYKSLVQLADERGVRLVVDKSAILYGQEAIDLTEALSRRVRGLPEDQP